jgi:hypothetical protein
MIKDSLNSILGNIKERTTNPFLGTLIVVWVVHNWRLVYSIFYFDRTFKLEQRLGYINRYFNDNPFLSNLLWVVVMTVFVLLFTYFMLSISRLITDTQERIVVPMISKWTDGSSVVLKSDYLVQKEIIKQLELRLEEERLAKVAAQQERDNVDAKLADVLKAKDVPDITFENESTGKVEVADPVNVQQEDDEHNERICHSLGQLNNISYVNRIIVDILNGTLINRDDEVIDILLRGNIVKTVERSNVKNRYEFTERGVKFVDMWNKSVS